MPVIGIYGAGGCGRGVMPLARAQYGEKFDLLFVDDGMAGKKVNGMDAVSFEQFAALDDDKYVNLAIADGALRKKLAESCIAKDIGFVDITASKRVVMDDVIVGGGAIFSPFTTLTSNIRIGGHFHCNLYSYVEHDCVIGDFVTFAPAVRCNGNVTIGDGAYIGSGAIIRQGISIGANAVVGMGAVVTKDVPAGTTVVGNPAKPMKP